jgi:hypothetical protein
MEKTHPWRDKKMTLNLPPSVDYSASGVTKARLLSHCLWSHFFPGSRVLLGKGMDIPEGDLSQ